MYNVSIFVFYVSKKGRKDKSLRNPGRAREIGKKKGKGKAKGKAK